MTSVYSLEMVIQVRSILMRSSTSLKLSIPRVRILRESWGSPFILSSLASLCESNISSAPSRICEGGIVSGLRQGPRLQKLTSAFFHNEETPRDFAARSEMRLADVLT